VDYYFIAAAEFSRNKREAFIEWEMVYEGKYYGTLKAKWKEFGMPGGCLCSILM